MKLWIDDLRDTPDDGPGWYVTRTSAGAIEFLKDYVAGYVLGVLEEISFDHDLGGEDTTRPVMLWMIENNVWPDRIFVHTANPVGASWLVGMADRYSPAHVEVVR